MKVLMFGWEFPPFSSGGLGTACYGLTRGLSNNKVDVTFVVPYARGAKADYVKLISAGGLSKVKIKGVESPIEGYMTSEEYEDAKEALSHGGAKNAPKIYGKNLFAEVERYAKKAELIARHERFDVIHAHDWMTYKAGMRAKMLSKKPLVIHVHATEFDRTGGLGVNQRVYDVEREGMHAADKIIAVSQFTKNKIVEHYGVPADKIHVVHNAVEQRDISEIKKKGSKLVLFLGRITLQKGPDYFLYAAKRALDTNPNIKFVIAGKGDMSPFIIEKAAELGISDKVLFAGFLRGKEIDDAYRMADLYVMPSVSEPFGITPLESMSNGTPVLISKQSGVSEVISHCLKADFWDIDDMANKIVSVLSHDVLQESLTENGNNEVKKFNWDDSARKCINIYNQVIQ
ncbi:glycosyltransferase family 4 protein [Candidatus Woesearchaeota archaeon]|nr:glycosyltransferase family 4 protein [Candidatus Woesearchaeota archaeon]